MSLVRFFARFVSRDLARRDFSLDALRGLLIIGMIMVNHPPRGLPVFAPLAHAVWHGWTLADVIFPGFLFAVGISIRFAMVDERGSPTMPGGAIYAKVLWRFLMLMGMNFMLVNFPYYFWGRSVHFMGTLAVIAWSYLFAAMIYLHTGWRLQLAIVAVVLGAQWAILMLLRVPGHGIGIMSPEANAASYLDRIVFDGRFEAAQGGDAGIVLVPLLGSTATTLIGVLAGRWLRSMRKQGARLWGLFVVGLLMYAVGSASHALLPINKQLWTATYVLLMAGIAMQLFAAISWLGDTCGYKAWAMPLRIAGTNALFFYLLAQSLQRILVFGRVRTEDGVSKLGDLVWDRFFAPWTSGEMGALIYVLVFLAILYVFVLLLYWRRIFFKL